MKKASTLPIVLMAAAALLTGFSSCKKWTGEDKGTYKLIHNKNGSTL